MSTDYSKQAYAALDMGSNSFHLMVARFSDGKLRVIDRYKDMVRLAAGLDENRQLSDEAISRALEALPKFAERLSGIPKRHIRVAGTNTLRTARGAQGFLKEAEKILGVPINIISGTEEARLIYLGVASDFSPDEKKRLVIDIGGGSTELVIGKATPTALESLPMGCVSFSRRFFANGELSAKQFQKAVKAARQLVSPYSGRFKGGFDEAVGASGTIRHILHLLEANGLDDDHRITSKGLIALRDMLIDGKHIDKFSINGLKEERRPVFPGGLAVLIGVFAELKIDAMGVSNYAIREGMIYDLAGRYEHRDIREQTIEHFMRQYHVDSAQAQRVETLTTSWLGALSDQIHSDQDEAANLLRWAACLHEIGLAIAHGGYHKHGAYILSHADMPGFSRQEQKRLAFLVLNHRRKPKAMPEDYSDASDWFLVALLRIAFVIHRRRADLDINAALSLSADKGCLTLCVDEQWWRDNPLIAADLEDEQAVISNTGISLKIKIR